MFKPGDKIVILDTSLFDDYDNKLRTIIDRASAFDWECNRSCVDENNIRHATPEEITAGHKLDTKKSTEMENFKVKVTKYTYPILQDVALSNGYGWPSGEHKEYSEHMGYIYFINGKLAHSKTICGGDKHPLISLEEAIEKICKKEKLKEGDYIVANYRNGNKEHKGKVAKVLNEYRYEYLDGFVEDNSYNFEGCRKATEDEIKNALIETAKERGFPCRKWKFEGHVCNFTNLDLKENWKYRKDTDTLENCSGIIYRNGEWATPVKDSLDVFGFTVQKTTNDKYRFGCNGHIYTSAELHRIIRTLCHVDRGVTAEELVGKLEKVMDL